MTTLAQLKEVLPSLSRDQLQKLLAEMKTQKIITVIGRTSAARWYPYPAENRKKNG